MDKPDSKAHRLLPAVTLALLAIVLLAALLHFFALSFESGDAYPPYSSFRSDPLGTRVYYEALSSMPNLSVTRRLEPIVSLENGAETTLLLCGGEYTKMEPRSAIEALERFITSGGRLVVTVYPIREQQADCRFGKCASDPSKEEEKEEKAEDESKDETDKKDKPSDDDDEIPASMRPVSLEERWGFKYAFDELPEATDEALGSATAQKQAGPDYLPAALPYHSNLYFSDLDPAWTILYSWDDRAVVIERPWENGSIVLCSDSYFLSNEAIQKEQQAGLLTWLIGPSTNVAFDETHLGISERPNTMTLIRAYRLHFFLIALLLLGLLYIWKNTSSLIPKRNVIAETSPDVSGQDAASGLVNLLRRSIPSDKIVEACIDEWRRSFAKHPQQATLHAALHSEGKLPPVTAYQRICAILAERKKP